MTEKEKIIVIIEDDKNDLELLVRFLKKIGLDDEFQNLVFRNLDGILNFLIEQKKLTENERTRVAAFFVDGNVTPTSKQGRDGIQIIEEIRKDNFYNSTPIISNSGGGEIKGADYDNCKVFSTDENRKATITNLIRQGRPINI